MGVIWTRTEREALEAAEFYGGLVRFPNQAVWLTRYVPGLPRRRFGLGLVQGIVARGGLAREREMIGKTERGGWSRPAFLTHAKLPPSSQGFGAAARTDGGSAERVPGSHMEELA